MNNLKISDVMFDKIRHIDSDGNEFWYARELQGVLEYKRWDKFANVIDNAKIACKNSKNLISNHFSHVGKMVDIGSKTSRKIDDYMLSRYACYLIAQNGDSRKKAVALAQTYFAIQTRRQELSDKEYSLMTEDDKRFFQRNLTKKGNYALNQTAMKAGVKNFDKFHNAGYRGLYNGETADDIAKRKGLRYREEILDNMCSEELADNLFRIVQTDAKLKRDNVDNENTANSVHYEIGKKVRKAIADMGGIMPEDLPTPDKSLKQLDKERKKELVDNYEKLLNDK